MPKFAANLSMMFNELPFMDRFKAAKAAGFSAVEFLFPYEHGAQEVADALRANGLHQALFNLPPGDWDEGDRGLAALPARRTEASASIKTALPYILATGVPNVHMMAGIAPRSAPECRSAYEDNIREAAEALAAVGCGLVIEPINSRDMPGYYLDDFEYAVELLDRMALPNLGLQFDIYHRQIMHGDVTTALKAMLPMIRHIQIAAVPTREEPGSGELQDYWLFQLLDDLGYYGYVGCEYRPKESTLAGLKWMAEYANWTDRRSPNKPYPA